MERNELFDLPCYVAKTFPGLSFKGALFYHCRFGLRFEIGLHTVPRRPVELFEAIFDADDDCILVAKEWPSTRSEPECGLYSLFTLPDVFIESVHIDEVGKLECGPPNGDDADTFTLRWITRISRRFRCSPIFQAIANNDNGATPSVNGYVYFINPRANIIVHMYDDRGMDVVAATPDKLRFLYQTFSKWILEYDRERILKALSIDI